MADVCDFDRLSEAWRALEPAAPFPEEFLTNLHNHLVWRSFVPGENETTDRVVRAVIRNLLVERQIQDIDDDVKTLARRLFS